VALVVLSHAEAVQPALAGGPVNRTADSGDRALDNRASFHRNEPAHAAAPVPESSATDARDTAGPAGAADSAKAGAANSAKASAANSARDIAADSARVCALLDSLVSEGRHALKYGEFDLAAQDLRAAVDLAGSHPGRREQLGQAYLYLISTYVQRGNWYKNEPYGRETSDLFYREGRRCIEECLSRRELRHLRAEPPTRFPPEMHALFDRVRLERFGTFRVVQVSPPEAEVLLDGELVPADSALVLREESDVSAGEHEVVVRCSGYRDLVEKVLIAPGELTDRVYNLKRRRGVLWYTGRSALVLGAAAAAVLFTRPEEAGPRSPLPEPTTLPSGHRP